MTVDDTFKVNALKKPITALFLAVVGTFLFFSLVNPAHAKQEMDFSFLDTDTEELNVNCLSEFSGKSDTAFETCKKRAIIGSPVAQTVLGYIHYEGIGTSQDYEEGRFWFERASEQGYVSAQYTLGYSYFLGLGVPKDYVKSVYWLEKAAKQGHAIAQRSLGYMYLNGSGTKKDDIKAYKWFNLSASKGDELAAKERELLESIMTSAQIIEAQKLSREFSEIIFSKTSKKTAGK